MAMTGTSFNFKVAEAAIDLFLEYRDKHGFDEATAKAKALCEFLDEEGMYPPDSAARLERKTPTGE